MKKSSKNKKPRILITGGAGFIGTNAADYFLSRGWSVTVLDNFSRKGSRENAQWLRSTYGSKVRIQEADVSNDAGVLALAVVSSDAVLHLAGQTAVTTSFARPMDDFRANVVGTLNVLEAIRASANRPPLIYSSTNKVYGGMEGVRVQRTAQGYRYRDLPRGVSESFPLDFHSPYGCSKGASDQYVSDYARMYGLDTVVLRQSCIYGPRQFGIEDQGWVAWFAIAAVNKRPITIYGDGWQVRDVLHVTDLCRLYESVFNKIKRVRGRVYNVGGGPANILSLRQTLSIIDEELGDTREVSYADWRPGDQRIYVSDIRKASKELGWRPRISVARGVTSLVRWVRENRDLFR